MFRKTVFLTGILVLLAAFSFAEGEKKIISDGTYLHRFNNQDNQKTKITLTTVDNENFTVSTLLGKDNYTYTFSKKGPAEYSCIGGDSNEYELVSTFKPKSVLESRKAFSQKTADSEYYFYADGAIPFFLTRPDPQCSIFLLVNTIDYQKKEAQTFNVYDFDQITKSLIEFKLSVTVQDENGISLPNGKFKAIHLVMVPNFDNKVSSLKKNKYGRIDCWVDESRNILRLYRYKDFYELILQDYNNPAGLIDANDKMQAYKVPPLVFDHTTIEGELAFKGVFSHRFNNSEIAKETLYVKKQKDGGTVFISDFSRNTPLVYFDPDNRLTKYVVKVADETKVEYVFEKDKMKIVLSEKTIEFNKAENTYPDLNTRPDPFLLQLSYLKKFDLAKNEPQEFTVFDTEKKGGKLLEYKVKVQKLGEEDFAVGKDKIKTFHLQVEVLSTVDTALRKEKGMITEYWLTAEGVPVRVLKPSDKYEKILIEMGK